MVSQKLESPFKGIGIDFIIIFINNIRILNFIQVILDSLKNDLNNLKSLIEICTSDISANSSFSRDRVEEAKVT